LPAPRSATARGRSGRPEPRPPSRPRTRSAGAPRRRRPWQMEAPGRAEPPATGANDRLPPSPRACRGPPRRARSAASGVAGEELDDPGRSRRADEPRSTRRPRSSRNRPARREISNQGVVEAAPPSPSGPRASVAPRRTTRRLLRGASSRISSPQGDQPASSGFGPKERRNRRGSAGSALRCACRRHAARARSPAAARPRPHPARQRKPGHPGHELPRPFARRRSSPSRREPRPRHAWPRASSSSGLIPGSVVKPESQAGEEGARPSRGPSPSARARPPLRAASARHPPLPPSKSPVLPAALSPEVDEELRPGCRAPGLEQRRGAPRAGPTAAGRSPRAYARRPAAREGGRKPARKQTPHRARRREPELRLGTRKRPASRW